MGNIDDSGINRDISRRSFLGITGVVAAVTIAGGLSAPAVAELSAKANVNGRRKLGSLEVSTVGLGIQNMSRKYETTVPYRPEMIDIIRAAYDHSANFATYKTYSWLIVQAGDSLWNDRLKQDVDAQLASKGWTKTESGGDAMVSAFRSTQNEQTLQTFYDGFGGG